MLVHRRVIHSIKFAGTHLGGSQQFYNRGKPGLQRARHAVLHARNLKSAKSKTNMAALGFFRKRLVLASFRTVSRVKHFFKATASFPPAFTKEEKKITTSSQSPGCKI